LVLIPPSEAYRAVFSQAQEIASASGSPFSTLQLLLALFTTPNTARLLLMDHQVNEETLLASLDQLKDDQDVGLKQIERSSLQIARGSAATELKPLHLLASFSLQPKSLGSQLLEQIGLDLRQLARLALSCAEDPQERARLRARYARRPAVLEVAHLDTLESPSLTRVVESLSAVGGQREQLGLEQRRGTDRRAVTRGRRASDHPPQEQGEPSPKERPLPSEDSPSPYVLNKERFYWLHALGRNLSHLAFLGHLDPIFGREQEIEESLDILNKRRSNNPCLLGDPGVGKSAIAEGLAQRLIQMDREERPPKRVIIQLDVGSILAGTQLRGALAERLRGIQEEVRRASGRVIIFIDELHTLVGAGGGDGGHDAANELKASLARGEFPCIGATTQEEYRKHIESDAALERRFTPVHIEEPDLSTTRRILKGIVPRYEEHHAVRYLPEALEAALRLSRRYIHDRRDPDRCLNVLDLAGAVARRNGRAVDHHAVAQVISRRVRVPIEHLLLDSTQRFLKMEEELSRGIKGQGHVLKAIAETIRRNLAGFAGRRPIGSFLFLGPTGVGKTEVVRVLATFLFGSQDALTRFDMSEYAEAHSLARLIGSPPGYIGHQEGGQLTDSLRRRPYQVLLFDEIEKAHREIWNLLLQILEEGQLTNNRGRKVDFSNAVVVLTSNLGAEVVQSRGRIGFSSEEDGQERSQRALSRAQASFPPELWGRLERKLVFHALSRAQIRGVAELIIQERSRLLYRERGIRFSATEAAIELLIEEGGFLPELGARPMRQLISQRIESPLAERILAGALRRGEVLRVHAEGGELSFQVRSLPVLEQNREIEAEIEAPEEKIQKKSE